MYFGFRPGQVARGDDGGTHPDRRVSRHSPLHLTGTGRRQAGRPPWRPLCGGAHSLRDGDGGCPLLRAVGHGDDAPAGSAATEVRAQQEPRGTRILRPHHHALPGEGSGGALSERARSSRGPAGGALDGRRKRHLFEPYDLVDRAGTIAERMDHRRVSRRERPGGPGSACHPPADLPLRSRADNGSVPSRCSCTAATRGPPVRGVKRRPRTDVCGSGHRRGPRIEVVSVEERQRRIRRRRAARRARRHEARPDGSGARRVLHHHRYGPGHERQAARHRHSRRRRSEPPRMVEGFSGTACGPVDDAGRHLRRVGLEPETPADHRRAARDARASDGEHRRLRSPI